MSRVGIVYPHQLFASNENPLFVKGKVTKVILVEDPLYFSQYRFHRQKLMLHRASMKAFQSALEQKGIHVLYVESSALQHSRDLFDKNFLGNASALHIIDTVDDYLEQAIRKGIKSLNIRVVRYDTPMFMTTHQECVHYVSDHKRLLMADFYQQQRIQHNILVTADKKPIGGRWSFDSENRKKLPKNISIPSHITFPADNVSQSAYEYVVQKFPRALGTDSALLYGYTHAHAHKALQDFLVHKLKDFGPYEDAMTQDHQVIFHSVLTPYLNIGLLTPSAVIKKTLAFGEKHMIPIASLEGFIRQIIGWREFMRLVYVSHGKKMRTHNFWHHQKKLSSSWYIGSTGLGPVDHVVNQIQKTGYAHHIERLMVLGNAMLLARIHPDQVYQWFMEFFIDAYDWVMVPNVYGMSQFADGGVFATKPYVSGSNYIRKMSDFKQGEWCDIWDGLYWRFIEKHADFFKKNHRMNMMVKQLEKMDHAKKDRLKKTVQKWERKLSV